MDFVSKSATPKRFKFNPSELSTGIWVPLLILVIGGLGYFVFLPKYRAVQSSREDLAIKKADVELRESQLAGVKVLVQELEQQKPDLAPVDKAIPTAPQIPELLANFDYLARQSGLFLSSVQFTPLSSFTAGAGGQKGGEQSRELDATLPKAKNLGVLRANLELRGGYDNLKNFLLAAEQNLRLMDVEALFIITSKDSPATKEFTLIVQTYYHLPERRR